MAYIRKVRTGSGATAVQIVRKERGEVILVEHIGSGHTKKKVDFLVDEARAKLLGGKQKPLFDLEKLQKNF